MRKTIIIALSAACLSFSGCSFLNVEMIGKSTIESFFSDMSGLVSAGEGLHSTMLNFYDDIVLRCPELGGDMLNENSLYADDGSDKYFNFSLDPSYNSSYPLKAYSTGYVVVTNANNIIYYGPRLREKNPNREADVNRIVGYAYFARALAFFQLCNLYAQPWIYTADQSHLGVPIVTYIPGFDDVIARRSVRYVYEQIEEDLLEALSLFNKNAGGEETSVSDVYHVSGIACEAMLARFYLYKNDWEEAAKWSDKVMKKVPLSPRDEYVAMYRNSQETHGKESIFRLNGYGKTSGMRAFYDPTTNIKFYPDPTVSTWYDDDDIRKELLTYVGESCEDAYAGKTFSAVCKYLAYKSITDETKRVPDPFVLRVSEMYLIHAEAVVKGPEHDLAGAADDLKALIARAKGCDKSAVSLSYSTQKDMEELIDFERRRELAYEGHRQFDILRTGSDLKRSATSNARVKELKYPAYNFILPIAQMEMQANEAMIQNEGYDK